MKKHLGLIFKIIIMGVVAWFLGKKIVDAWGAIDTTHISITWSWGVLAVAAFCGSMLTSACVWRSIARQMERGDLLPTPRLLAAYTFSQLGKYVPGKVALLLMRIQRAGRFGMSKETCTLSTLLENALYMISGGLTGMVAIAGVSGELNPGVRPFLWPIAIALVGALLAACHPAVFYWAVNRLLKKMKRTAIEPGRRLTIGPVLLAVAGFLPCWLFGGIALWASLACVHPLDLASAAWFAGAYALSVIIGMASFLPGGLGIREAVLVAAVTLQLTSQGEGHDKAVVLATCAAALQRIFQLAAEILLGLAGGYFTSSREQRAAAANAQ